MDDIETLKHKADYWKLSHSLLVKEKKQLKIKVNSAWRDMVRIGNELGLKEKDITPDAIVNEIALLKDDLRRYKKFIAIIDA